MKASIKTKIVLSSFVLFTLSSIVIIFFVYFNFKKYAIEENVDKARKTAKQLVAMRGYMATIAPYVKFTKNGINRWAATPAYSGAQVAKKVGEDAGFYIKQTALNYRNPLNKPNENEKKIINIIEKKNLQEYWEIGDHNGVNSILYGYRLTVKDACLKCHGVPLVDVPKGLYEKLKTDYGDKAFNFKRGDLRGIVSVAIPMEYAGKSTVSLIIKIAMISIVITAVVFVAYYFTANFITRSIYRVSHHLKNISTGQGDLTVHLDVDSNDEIGELSKNFNTFVDKLRMLIIEVKHVARNLADAMEEQSLTSQAMSQNSLSLAEKQEEIITESNNNTKSVEDISASVEVQTKSFNALGSRVAELSEAIVNVSSESKQAMSLAGKISEKIRSGEEALNSTNNAMRNIEESSREMTGIMKMINDIADQINLLSLNAAIESARAGEAGRGFAVVADEISKLADETGASIKNIDTLIKTNEGEIEKGIGSVKNTVRLINSIIEDISLISDTINKMFDFMQMQIVYNEDIGKESASVKNISEDINRAIEEHKISTGKIEVSISEIGKVLQDSAAASEELTAQTVEINKLSAHLKNLVDRFKV